MDTAARNLIVGLAGIAIYILIQQVGLINPIITTAPANWEYSEPVKKR